MTANQLNRKFKLRSDKLAKFCLEYVKDLNATQSAIRAGYSKKTAQRIGSENLSKLVAQNCIAYLQAEAQKRTKYGPDDLKNDLLAIKNMSLSDIYDDNDGVKPISQWPMVWLTSCTAYDIQELTDSKNQNHVISIIKKIKFPDQIKVLELLGKHIDIQAWREVHKLETSSFAELLKEANDRDK